jgi:hypothetical protein
MDMSDREEVQVEEPASVKKVSRQTVDVAEVLAQLRSVGLKLVVLGSGAIAGVADLAGMAARGVQSAACRRLDRVS